jgi:hypothetical protein
LFHTIIPNILKFTMFFEGVFESIFVYVFGIF